VPVWGKTCCSDIRDALEEQVRLPAGCLDTDSRVAFGVIDADAPQPLKFCFVVRGNVA